VSLKAIIFIDKLINHSDQVAIKLLYLIIFLNYYQFDELKGIKRLKGEQGAE
jgi:hypothetical protein